MSAQSSGARIRALRSALGLTQAGVAARVGVTTSAVSQWEAGSSSVLGKHLVKLAGVLGVPPGELMSDTTEPTNDALEMPRLEAAIAELDKLPQNQLDALSAGARARLIAHLYSGGVRTLQPVELQALVKLVK